MADNKTIEQRSRNMQAIRGKDTSPERYIRRLLFTNGFRYRKNYSRVVGSPDIWLAKYKTAVFVHGCYWHRHRGCRYAYVPKSNIVFWEDKFQKNVIRDSSNQQQLISEGIKVLIIWECIVRRMLHDDDYERLILSEIKEFLFSEILYAEL